MNVEERRIMDEQQIPNNICCSCRKRFYVWFHGQGMICPECTSQGFTFENPKIRRNK